MCINNVVVTGYCGTAAGFPWLHSYGLHLNQLLLAPPWEGTQTRRVSCNSLPESAAAPPALPRNSLRCPFSRSLRGPGSFPGSIPSCLLPPSCGNPLATLCHAHCQDPSLLLHFRNTRLASLHTHPAFPRTPRASASSQRPPPLSFPLYSEYAHRQLVPLFPACPAAPASLHSSSPLGLWRFYLHLRPPPPKSGSSWYRRKCP